MVQTLVDTIVWHAEERMKVEPFQNRNSAIHAVMMDVSQVLMGIMACSKEER